MNANVLERPTLVLNRNWQPVNVATVSRALVLLWNESARVIDVADYQTFSWDDWSKLRPRDDEAFVQAISMRLRVPEVIALSTYDRQPQSAVTFTRRAIGLSLVASDAGEHAVIHLSTSPRNRTPSCRFEVCRAHEPFQVVRVAASAMLSAFSVTLPSSGPVTSTSS
jgi:hypothetical protein